MGEGGSFLLLSLGGRREEPNRDEAAQCQLLQQIITINAVERGQVTSDPLDATGQSLSVRLAGLPVLEWVRTPDGKHHSWWEGEP